VKKITALLLAAAMSLSLAACGSSNTSTNTSTNTGSTTTDSTSTGNTGSTVQVDTSVYEDLPSVELVGADSTGKGAAGQLFGELVAARVDELTGGKLTIDYHPNGDLGGDADLLRQMQSNDIQLVVCQTAPVVSFVPDVAVFDLPMVFAKYDGETIDKVLNGDSEFAQTLGQSFNDAGFQLLGTLQNATYRLTTSNTNLQTLADFKGLKIRTMENSNHMAFWTAIGAEPTPLAFSELYFSLQSGAVTAEENAADTIVGNSFNEVQKYLACTNHILYANMMTMNKDAWDSLDPLYQAALQEAVAEALDEIGSQLATIDQDNKDALVSKGMELIEYDESFFDEVLAVPAVQDLYAQIDESVNGLGTILQNELAEG
jgi:tripartite ATP-independent transporter DctP family solute receptor